MQRLSRHRSISCTRNGRGLWEVEGKGRCWGQSWKGRLGTDYMICQHHVRNGELLKVFKWGNGKIKSGFGCSRRGAIGDLEESESQKDSHAAGGGEHGLRQCGEEEAGKEGRRRNVRELLEFGVTFQIFGMKGRKIR